MTAGKCSRMSYGSDGKLRGLDIRNCLYWDASNKSAWRILKGICTFDMMGIKQRVELIERIKNIQDPRVIEEIYRLLDVTIEEESVYIPTDEQKKAIAQAREEINRGEGVPFEEVDKEFDAWLNE